MYKRQVCRYGGGRRGVRIDSEVDIAECAELSFEHDTVAAFRRFSQEYSGIADVILEFAAVGVEVIHHILEGGFLRAVHVLDHEILVRLSLIHICWGSRAYGSIFRTPSLYSR